ncbi:ESCRT-III subunit protein vps20 [Pseudogymnoascus destructans]|uniref:Vacuolar protein sorting-associated protein 20 n=2 Tax=Pseudogymnoascus destructans TaxID=655981 RepID=L8FP09_PSED2|nr:ESCRT-III subunit protein vps20 [Pseudogymnoascus destructans]XP_024325020.1 ESCRT-III subunit protein vps20 [Pseudogymnoascus destructans]ELR02617.1 hypothetical protein GMDG_05580 [Pseudogymnoascus destructans 20631-21]OAF54205.1 ESCRT-III subunit protein vps20 [Pseudogymnoascus destructans]OAF59737.1 ESCRT-III subunit protein vps20 [Pseudogymnoascus destructans]
MGSTASKPSAQDEAILNLKIQRDRLHKYQKRITVITAREHAIAATLLKQGDRPRALLALRRKKYQESLLAKTDAQLEQLEVLTSSVEFALVQKDVVFGLREGTRVLTEIQKEMGGLEQVEKLMGETAEAVAYQQEVSDMLGGKISNQDEDEVEDELEALEAQVTGVMPSVPTTKLPSKERAGAREKQREEQREERQAMLAS